MNGDDFDILLKRRIEKTRKVLVSKNAEYASDTDKLHNFKRAGDMNRCSPEKALIGMWTKHIISLLDIVDELEEKCGTNANTFPAFDMVSYMDKIDEKIGDAVNYLILLEALIKERYERLVMHID
jgi:hypothetical protein